MSESSDMLAESALRIDAALSEVGMGGKVVVQRGVIVIHESVPDETAWRAVALTEPLPGFPCWPCLSDRSLTRRHGAWPTCDHDWRSERWPEVRR